MHNRYPALFTLAAALACAGCATAIPPVEVTRFHRVDSATAIPPGTYAIILPPAEPGNPQPSLADRSYAAATAQQLERLGYRPAPDQVAADYLVTLDIERIERPAGAEGAGVSVGVGGSTGGYRSGVGVGVGLDLTRLFADRRDTIATRLAVRIARRDEPMALWEGRAETVARSGTPAAQVGLAAQKLASALFADFPGRSGETISVP